jgi:hypothetical protein
VPQPEEAPPVLLSDEVRSRVATVKQDLRSLLQLLSEAPLGRAVAASPDVPSRVEPRAVPAEDSWPPVAGPAAGKTPTDVLPLLEGVPDVPAKKARRSRRAAKDGGEPKPGTMVE